MEETGKSVKGSGRRLPKPNNVITVHTSPEKDLFRWWCIFLRPFINLTNREIDVVSSFLKQRWELSKHILDQGILDTMLMSEDTKRKVMEDCGITLAHFYVLMSSLRKNNIITSKGINPRLIPNIREDDNGSFQLLVLFKDTGGKA